MILCSLILSIALQASPRTLITDLPDDSLPEGVEWDMAHSRFLISSIRQQRIASVDAVTGHATPFASAPGSVLGLHIDASGRTVWAAWTQFGHAFIDNRGTGLSTWSTDNAHAIGDWPLPDTDPKRNFGDLTLVDAHTIVASDSGTGAVWRFDIGTHRYTSLVAAGKFKSPQGLVPTPRGDAVFLADYPTGLWRVALADGAATPLTSPAGVELRGIDGLYRRGAQLIAVQNGTKTPRILSITLDATDSISNVRRWLEMPDQEPGLGTMTGDAFWFVDNGQWSQYDDDLKPKADAKLQAPALRALPLSELARHK